MKVLKRPILSERIFYSIINHTLLASTTFVTSSPLRTLFSTQNTFYLPKEKKFNEVTYTVRTEPYYSCHGGNSNSSY